MPRKMREILADSRREDPHVVPAKARIAIAKPSPCSSLKLLDKLQDKDLYPTPLRNLEERFSFRKRIPRYLLLEHAKISQSAKISHNPTCAGCICCSLVPR